MSTDHWFALFQMVVTAVVSVIVFFWGRDRKQGQDAIDRRFDAIERELREQQQSTQLRFDHASHESSKMTGIVQALIGRVDRLPDELRAKFVSLDVWEVWARRERRPD